MKISQAIYNCRSQNRVALIPYMVGCYPDDKSFIEIFKTVAKFADVVEIGVPFSDPLADGPIIQKASAYALSKGITIEKILKAIEGEIGKKDVPPVVLMTYYNTVYKYGEKRFAKLCAENKISGTVIPDLPAEEADSWIRASKDYDLDTVFLVAPNSSEKRQKIVASSSTGFIYCVSVTGITGKRDNLPDYIKNYLEALRKLTDKPLALGFGISKPEHVKQVAPYCDAVIVGSALVDIISPDSALDKNLNRVTKFLASFKNSLKK